MLIPILFTICHATFTGSIQTSVSEIQSTGVTYTFVLNFQTNIPATGKLVIRFPSQYTTSFSTSCTTLSGFTGASLSCQYASNTRMMTLTGAFPNTQRQLRFNVSGITNPVYVGTTDIFQVQSFQQSGSVFNLLESSGSNIRVVTTPGAIQSETLNLQNPTIGLSSLMTVQLSAAHQIPINGQIIMTLPKWNGDDPDSSQWISLVATSTSPGSVVCRPSTGLVNQFTSCIFTRGTGSTDTLAITLNEAVAARTTISFTVAGVLAPPSQQPLYGFNFATQTSIGQQIDQSLNPTAIFMQAKFPVQASQQQVSVSAQPTQILYQSNVTITIQNLNPLKVGAYLQIVIPPEFDISKNPLTLQASGQNIATNPTWSLNLANRTISIQAVNQNYVQQFDFIYVTIGGIINPAQTSKTSTFQTSFYDSSYQQIEYVNQGVYFQATVGGFISITVSATDPYINSIGVGYNFEITVANAFSNKAQLQIMFPVQLQVVNGAYLANASPNVNVTSFVTVRFGQEAILTDAFPNGGVAGETFRFTLFGVNNPATTKTTQPFIINMYYQYGVDSIANYTGPELTFTARPSSQIEVSATLSAKQTGQVNQNMTLYGLTPVTMPIQKGSSVRVYIPKDFTVKDYSRVAASCTNIVGFTDETTCQFQSQENFATGNYLWVYGGWDSSNFPGGLFAFSITGVQNPFSSAPTESFQITVYDQYNNPQYISSNTFTLSVAPSPFYYQAVQSSSPQNGVSSMMQFSFTLGVDTPAGKILNIIKPDDLQWDTSKPFTCTGDKTIQGNGFCNFQNGVSLTIQLMPQQGIFLPNNVFLNGTAIQLSVGYIFNPLTLQSSKTWQVQTYEQKLMKQYYYNQILQNLTITNTERGLIKVQNISVVNDTVQLGQNAIIQINLQSQNTIPSGSQLQVILPSNFQVQNRGTVLVNGVLTFPIFQLDKFSYYVTIPQQSQNFTIIVTSGLKNPVNGPYSYSSFSFEFFKDNYAIDSVISKQTWINQKCLSNCATCSGNLTSCSSCGTDPSSGVAFYKYGNQCLGTCPPGFYAGVNYQCLPCQSPCLQCNLGPTFCTQCDSNSATPYASLETLQCYSTCPSGTYVDKVRRLCASCVSPCYTCLNATECLSCDRTDPDNKFISFFGLNQKCYETCPAESVTSPSKTCIQCKNPCATCSEVPEKCTSCVKGMYLQNNQCVNRCQFGYFEDKTQLKCVPIAQLDIPFPFTIMAALFTILIGISHFLKGAGPDQKGTSFFITTLAFVDMLLRVNWIVLVILGFVNGYDVTFYGFIGVMAMVVILNLAVWRRFFKFKYNMDDNDQAFVSYTNHYPKTAKVLLALSYIISFQAVRLTYSKFLGKKQFMARFSRQKRYNRLIGQCSMLEVFFIYLPSIVLEVCEMFNYKQSDQIFYIGIDSIILVCYATVLISVVITLREPVMHAEVLFEWKELLRINVDSDPEVMYFDDVKQSEVVNTVEVRSAADFDQLKRQKIYQTERRHLEQTQFNQELAVDVNQYRLFEEKLNRIKLKSALYKNKRQLDAENVQNLGDALNKEKIQNAELSSKVEMLRKQLQNLQSEIEKTEIQRNEEVISTEQRKRKEIQKRTNQRLNSSPSGQNPRQKKNSKLKLVNAAIDDGVLSQSQSNQSQIEIPQVSPDRQPAKRSRSPEINKRSPKPKKKKQEQKNEEME